jgi:hypothetical protein
MQLAGGWNKMIVGIMYLKFLYPFIILVRIFNNRLTVSEFFLSGAKNACDYIFCVLFVFDAALSEF